MSSTMDEEKKPLLTETGTRSSTYLPSVFSSCFCFRLIFFILFSVEFTNLMITEDSGWKSYKNYERSGSISRLPLSGSDLTDQEIRSAASAPSATSFYPPIIHADLITPTAPNSSNPIPRPYGTPLGNHLISLSSA